MDYLKIEIEDEVANKRVNEAYKRLGCLKKTYPKEFSFLTKIKKIEDAYIQPKYALIKQKYDEVSKPLKLRYEALQTPPERQFFNQLLQQSKKAIFTSVPVGSHIIDIFIPNVRSQSSYPQKVMRGLAIEIDGDIHTYESKMKKDNRKGEELKSIGIGLTHIENWDFSNPSVQLLKNQYAHLNTLDSRERKRLWRRIMLLTLAIRLNNKEFFQLFKTKQISIEEK